jgi:enoyl-CoA hydratase
VFFKSEGLSSNRKYAGHPVTGTKKWVLFLHLKEERMTAEQTLTFRNIAVEKKGAIATVTIDRQKVLNALNGETLDELFKIFDILDGDDEVSVIILTGAGEKSFVSGADISELSGLTAITAISFARRGQGVNEKIEQIGKPVIAAINGFALGGGCELALACDIRIASEKARFGQPEVKLGIIPGYGGTQRLPRLVGKGKAMELILSGDIIDAQEALRTGLVDRVVPHDSLMEEACRLACRIAENAPLAVRAAKKAVHNGLSMDLQSAMHYEAVQFATVCATADKSEGTQAFLEKRKAAFACR